jgi:hypothetical protein
MTARRRVISVVVTLTLLSASGIAWSQARDEKPIVIGTATLSGTVMTDEPTPAPARRATVTLRGDVVGRRGIVAVSDENGRFAFTNLPADRYSLTVSKGGYLTAEYGSRRPGQAGIPVPVADGGRVSGLTLKLQRGCTLSGTVVDEAGQPVPGVPVSALRYASSLFSGERTLQQVDDAAAITDDRGMYRIYGLPPSDYLVAAALPTLESSRTPADIRQITDADIQRAVQLARTPAGVLPAAGAQPRGLPPGSTVDLVAGYHPAAMSPADATTIALGPRDERTGIDVMVRLIATTRVDGIASTADGKPVANANVYIMNPPPLPPGHAAVTMRTARTDRDGRFVFVGIPPGRYTIGTGTVDLGVVTEVTIEGRQMTLPLTFAPPVVMKARVVFEGAAQPPSDPKAVLPTFISSLESPAMLVGFPQTNPDSTFTFRFLPGSYRVIGFAGRRWPTQAATGWTLKSIVVDGVDVTDVRFDVKPGDALEAVVTYTALRSEISGSVLDAAGKPATQFTLVLYSADRRYWIPQSRRTQEVRAGSDGRFLFSNLPPGDYLISAVDDIDPGDSNDAAFLAMLATHQPIRISLGPGEKKSQDIRAGG